MILRRTRLALALLAGLATPALAQTPAPIGVPECDEFLAAYDRCLNNNVPAANRAEVGAAVQQMRDSWRQAAQNPQSRATLGPQCTQMRQSMAQALGQAMAAYNCRF